MASLCISYVSKENLKESVNFCPALGAKRSMVPGGEAGELRSQNCCVSLEDLYSPGWRGLVGWVSSCRLKGCWVGPRSENMPGLWDRCSVHGGALAEGRRQPVDVSV